MSFAHGPTPTVQPPDAAGLPGSARALLLSEHPTLVGGPPNLFKALTLRERSLLLDQGTRRVFYVSPRRRE
jgi:hypothetical protein